MKRSSRREFEKGVEKCTQNSLIKAFKKESKGLEDAINKLIKLSQASDIIDSELEVIDEAIQHIQKRYKLVLNMQKLLEFSEDSSGCKSSITGYDKDVLCKKLTFS